MFAEQLRSVGRHDLNISVGNSNGAPVVLFHGVMRCWQDFSTVLPVLGARSQAFAVDHRGHGHSSRADRYLVADYIQDAVALVRSLESPAILMGHSLGALVSLGVAAEVPELVRGIVLEDPPSAPFLANVGQTAYAFQWKGMSLLTGTGRSISEIARELAELRLPGNIRLGDIRDAAALRFLARCLFHLDPAVYPPLLDGRWLDGFDPLAAAARVRCPAMILAADVSAGGMLPSSDADAFEAALSDPVRVNLSKIGHLIHASCPDVYLRTTLNFIDSLEPLSKRL